jgi:hypothetical protein
MGAGLLAFAKPGQMADGFADCTCHSSHGCDGDWEPHSESKDVVLCEECHDSLLHFLTDVHGSGERIRVDVAVPRLFRPDGVLMPEGPYLDGFEPPLI